LAYCSLHFYGNAISKQSGLVVITPEGREGPFPVLYLLHGLSDDQTGWARWTNLERYAGEHRLIIAMPDGHRSFYVNSPPPAGLAYEDHIVKDVVGFMDSTFQTIPHRRGRAVAGLSMGGYGAIMLAMRHPDIFAAAASHSGAVGFAHTPSTRADIEQITKTLPAGKYDCYRLARKLKGIRVRPAIRLDCGVDDFLIESNRKFHAHLDKLGISHVYEEYPGQHNWEYWDRHIGQTLAFTMEHVAKK
jgi:putative tributyrin esterase